MSGDTSPTSEEAKPSSKLFLGGLSWETTEDKLRDHFQKYGSIVEAVVMRDRQTGRPRGFGFVTFTTPEAADAVVQEVHVIDGRQIDAKKSVPQEQKPKARKVFVGGLSPETTEEQFRDYFSQYGAVMEAQIMQDHMSGRSRGFGFVTFAEDSSAENVFSAGTMHDLGGKKVEVKPATPKGSGSLARPGGSTPSTGARPGSSGLGPGGPGAGRPMPPFGGGSGGPGVFGSPPGAYGGYAMYGFPPGGMMPGGPYAMQYGSGMGGMGPAPYMMMPQGMGMGSSYPSAAFAFPGAGSGMQGPAYPGGGMRGGGGGVPSTPFAQQQMQQHHGGGQQHMQQQFPRPVRTMSRAGSRGAGKVDSASSLDQGAADVASVPASAVDALHERVGKLRLAE